VTVVSMGLAHQKKGIRYGHDESWLFASSALAVARASSGRRQGALECDILGRPSLAGVVIAPVRPIVSRADLADHYFRSRNLSSGAARLSGQPAEEDRLI
jgi:hypothetical protein